MDTGRGKPNLATRDTSVDTPTKPIRKHIHPIIVCSQARHTIEQWDAPHGSKQ
ncbi:unnamed protein product [Staurois parvus]|uniref:Uncharacterized protein n=1 Tax=Staurois parvus TaxID=386267 RepID=A0ABN9C6V9_9NEOB|nr:unnamed protein product [Staurois parvus]